MMKGGRQGSSNTQRPGFSQEPMLRVCSFCGKTFASLQALGGHQTKHRKEIQQRRREHEAFMAGQQLGLAPGGVRSASLDESPSAMEPGAKPGGGRAKTARGSSSMVPLAPNDAFWEAYRTTGQPPLMVDYVRVANHGIQEGKQEEEDMDHSTERTITDPRLDGNRHIEKGEEATSVNLDLTLKHR